MSNSTKKRILWISEYKIATGFARVTQCLLKYLAEHFDITVLDIYRPMAQAEVNGSVRHIGCDGNKDQFAYKRLKKIYADYDMIFIINDVWNINMWLHVMKQGKKPVPPVVVYFPVDAREHDADWYINFDLVKVPVTYTQFAKQVVLEAVKPFEQLSDIAGKLLTVPHGTDTEVFYKLHTPKFLLRRNFFKTERFDEDFIFLNANRNQPRKMTDITMKAFGMFLDNNPGAQAKLYLHCGVTDDYIDVDILSQRYGIAKNMMYSDRKAGIPRVSEETLNKIYNCCDVGLNSGIGEGWGLTNIEHAVTGAPQIVPAHSACKELFSQVVSEDLLIPVKCDLMQRLPLMTVGSMPDVEGMALLMERYYKNRELVEQVGKNCIEIFTSDRYKWRTIAEQWRNIFASV